VDAATLFLYGVAGLGGLGLGYAIQRHSEVRGFVVAAAMAIPLAAIAWWWQAAQDLACFPGTGPGTDLACVPVGLLGSAALLAGGLGYVLGMFTERETP
jgi:hypothetical protein